MYISDLPTERLETVSIPAFSPPAPRPWWPQRLIAALARWNAAGSYRLDEHLAWDSGFETYDI